MPDGLFGKFNSVCPAFLQGPGHFGEGIAVVRDEIYQLTWKSRVGFVYDKKTLRKLREFRLRVGLAGALEQAAEAHRLLETGQTTGSLVLTPRRR